MNQNGTKKSVFKGIEHLNLKIRCQIKVQNLIQVGYDFHLTVYSWMKIAHLKQMISKKTGLSEGDIKLVHKNYELQKNYDDLQYYQIKKNAVIKLLPRIKLMQSRHMLNPFEILDEQLPAYQKFLKVKWDVEGSLNMGIIPKLTDFGTQGTYILEGIRRDPVAIFKPQDEEAFAPNNPRGYIGKFSSPGLRQGVLSGEGVEREVAAFLLDQIYNGFHNGIQYCPNLKLVPITTYVEFCHPCFKSNEFLIYEPDSQTTEPMTCSQNIPIKRGTQPPLRNQQGPSNCLLSMTTMRATTEVPYFLFKKPIRQHSSILGFQTAIEMKKIYWLRKSTQLDLFNFKRKLENQCKNSRQSYDFHLIPIDHGYSFPDSFNICQDEVVWFHWDQMRVPFSEKEMQYIQSINPEHDELMIRNKLKFRDICLRNFRIVQYLLKEAAESGLTIHEISQNFCFCLYKYRTLLFREDSDFQSQIEKAVQRSEENYELGLRVPTTVSFSKLNGKTKSVPLDQSALSQSDKKIDPEEKRDIILQGKALQQNLTLSLRVINEECDSVPEEQKDAFKLLLKQASFHEEESPEYKPSTMKRSISQPSILLAKVPSKKESPRKNKIEYGEDFYPHIKWFISVLIQQKVKQCKSPVKKSYRERFHSEDL